MRKLLEKTICLLGIIFFISCYAAKYDIKKMIDRNNYIDISVFKKTILKNLEYHNELGLALYVTSYRGLKGHIVFLTQLVNFSYFKDYRNLDFDGNTALHGATSANHFHIVKILLDKDCDQFVDNFAGNCPAYIAKEKNYPAIEKLFKINISMITKRTLENKKPSCNIYIKPNQNNISNENIQEIFNKHLKKIKKLKDQIIYFQNNREEFQKELTKHSNNPVELGVMLRKSACYNKICKAPNRFS